MACPRCNGSGMVLYDAGPNQAGEMCPACGGGPVEEESYQNVELWMRELRAAGWRPWNLRRDVEAAAGATTWRSPSGLFYRGPYRAWTVMKGFE